MATERDNFSDRQKAEIFARDRAMCCYSGKSLWLLDYGAAPALPDHVDHVVAASHGGTSAHQNGVLATFMHNYLRGASKRPLQLFDSGMPNMDAFWIFGSIPDNILDHILRFEVLHYSDWYVNRAVASMRFAAAQNSMPKRVNDQTFARGTTYWCKVAVKRLKESRQSRKAEGVPSLEKRGLLPPNQRPDHQPFIKLLEAEKEEHVLALVETIEPYLNASHAAVEEMFSLPHLEEKFRAYAKSVSANPFVVEPTKHAVVDYINRMMS